MYKHTSLITEMTTCAQAHSNYQYMWLELGAAEWIRTIPVIVGLSGRGERGGGSEVSRGWGRSNTNWSGGRSLRIQRGGSCHERTCVPIVGEAGRVTQTVNLRYFFFLFLYLWHLLPPLFLSDVSRTFPPSTQRQITDPLMPTETQRYSIQTQY